MPMPMQGKETMPMKSDSEKTVLNENDYPELRGIQPGAEVSGRWTGKVESNENGEVTIGYTDMQITSGNSADRELSKMTDQPAAAGVGEQEEDDL